MPLMQLRRLVLPAPFGPIRAKSTPLYTFRETSSRIFSPPMERLTPSIRRSIGLSIPPSRSSVLLDITITRSGFPAALSQIELLDVLMIQKCPGASGKYDTAIFDHITIVSY